MPVCASCKQMLSASRRATVARVSATHSVPAPKVADLTRVAHSSDSSHRIPLPERSIRRASTQCYLTMEVTP